MAEKKVASPRPKRFRCKGCGKLMATRAVVCDKDCFKLYVKKLEEKYGSIRDE